MRVPPRVAGPLVLALAAALGGCAAAQETEDDVSDADTPAAAAAGDSAAGEWRPLFDGRSLEGWRTYRKTGAPAGWEVANGELTRTGPGGDIVTTEQFDDFELELEWKVEPGGNSGIMYRATEEAANAYETGIEMQVLDDSGHADGRSRLTAAGSVYGLYPAPEGVVKPAGEWNAARIVADGSHVEHWLNGRKIAEFELGSPDWERRVRGSKFVEWPGFGRARRGHIVLQDHGDRVAYRNIRIRAL